MRVYIGPRGHLQAVVIALTAVAAAGIGNVLYTGSCPAVCPVPDQPESD
jgi:hypothetical protein